MRFSRIIALVLAVVTVLCTVSCSVDLTSTEEESRTCMKVDGIDVPYEVFYYAVNLHLRDRLAAYAATNEGAVTGEDGTIDFSALDEDMRNKIWNEINEYSHQTIVKIYSLFTAAKEEGIDPFGDMINSLTDMKMEEIRATYKNDKEYLDTIKQFYMTDNVYSILSRYEIVFGQLYDKYVKDGKIDTTDEAVREYMNGDGAVRVKQILISFERHSEEEAYALALDVAKAVAEFTDENGVVDEAKFDDLTDKRGEDLFMFKNRDGYYICKGYSDKAFETAAFGLEIGHASKPVKVNAGYSIMLRAAKDPDFIDENLKTLSEACITGIYNSILDEYIENADVSYAITPDISDFLR